MDLSSYSTGTISVAVTFTGIVVVFLALVGLSLIVWLFGKFFTALANRPKKPADPQPQQASKPAAKAAAQVKPAMVVEDGIGDEIVAVIAAAVAAMGGSVGGYALRSVRRVKEARPIWAAAGLQQNTQPF
ncbi:MULTISPECIES: OadG family protein [Anaerotruncus]|uniref:OadG family protein n=1 Tax=Anaerotruncus TaxID=244127 RepID=UPI00082D0029|nr:MULTISPECIES: OadG family protein [Anaerotruncus]RGX54337.1 sodium pump decarboxylase subunit gamma [Anaerotruncus sp. AF02-27]